MTLQEDSGEIKLCGKAGGGRDGMDKRAGVWGLLWSLPSLLSLLQTTVGKQEVERERMSRVGREIKQEKDQGRGERSTNHY